MVSARFVPLGCVCAKARIPLAKTSVNVRDVTFTEVCDVRLHFVAKAVFSLVHVETWGVVRAALSKAAWVWLLEDDD